ncbi:MAG TPA: CPBP family intramembrane glutamic endopeptidase [Bryobacteraceae bacterium]|nr:CPBP family intramembrane glutamic endopeptidase [Bryobacteraceae bacterium]
MNGQTRRRAAAPLEVLGVNLAGPLVIWGLRRRIGVSVTNPLINLSVHTTDAELITASRQMFVLLMFQYAGYFLLAFPINCWYRRRARASYGLTRAGRSWTALFQAGLATVALSAWSVPTINLINVIRPLGETAPWRQALFDMSWRRWEFWLFSAVFSWALIPFLEELFFRGYCQRRLAEDWGDGPAIIGTACLFTFAHTQYLIPNAYSAGMIVSLLMLAIGFGVVFAWTRSLIPSMTAHSIINVPMTPAWQGVLLAVLVIGTVVAWRRGAAALQRVFSTASVAGCVALAVIGAGYAIAGARFDSLTFLAIAMVMFAVGLEAKERQRSPIVSQLSTSA